MSLRTRLATAKRRLSPYVVPQRVRSNYYYLRSAAPTWLDSALRAELHRNETLRGVHAGKRCFVVGNGPSLRGMQLTALRDEFVLTSNSFLQHASEADVALRSQAHAILDPFFFEGSTTVLRALAHDPLRPELLFFPLAQRSLAQRLLPNPHFLAFAGDYDSNPNLDITGPLPGGLAYSVTVPLLAVALFMGFERIYLVGCDHDMLSNVVGVQPLRIRESHFYREDQIADWGAMGVDYREYCQRIIWMFEAYRFVRDHAPTSQRIYNATNGGLLDVFERVSFDRLFR